MEGKPTSTAKWMELEVRMTEYVNLLYTAAKISATWLANTLWAASKGAAIRHNKETLWVVTAS